MGRVHGAGRHLASAGLLNCDTADYGEVASGIDKDLRGTWCMGQACAISNNDGRQIVHVGLQYRVHCPNCGGKNLYFDRISPLRAPVLKQRAERFLAIEAKRRAKK